MLGECSDPVFCFTSDLDWARESMVVELIDFFDGEHVPLTPFITHTSDAIKRYYRKDNAKYVGLHPNFAIATTHGDDVDSVVANTIKLWPDAKCFRSHLYVDSLLITQKFHESGFKYDSNTCLYLQPNITPLNLASGLLRFPVFFEDIIHADKSSCFRLPHFIDKLMTPGLKIFNVHPVHLCINTPSTEYYNTHRNELYSHKNWSPLIYDGDGTLTLITDILDFIQEQGFKTVYLEDLYQNYSTDHDDKGISPQLLKRTGKPVTNVSVWSGSGARDEYGKLTSEHRSEMVRATYNKMDGRDPYVTSPDFNLRDLEISFIIDTIQSLRPEDRENIIDVGCGNGLTTVRLAQSIQTNIVGIDYSKAMIEGANYLTQNFKQHRGHPVFRIGDARDLNFNDGVFDVAISQRLLLNLPDEETQRATILEMHRVLKRGGLLVMVEGTRDGLRRLNDLRVKVGLEAIPDTSETNVSSLKFEEAEIEEFLKTHFTILKKQHFGMYYLISRVVHPLLVAPDNPRYDAKINEVAKKLSEHVLDYNQMSHIVGYVLRAI